MNLKLCMLTGVVNDVMKQRHKMGSGNGVMKNQGDDPLGAMTHRRRTGDSADEPWISLHATIFSLHVVI